MARYPNTFGYQTPIGQGLQNISAAMMSGPSTYETQARREQVIGKRLENERERKRQRANRSISDVFGQMQMAGEQTSGFVDPAEDEGLQTLVRGAPVATAKYAAGTGGVSPDMARGLYSAMSQYGDEEALRRTLPLLGQTPTAGTAVTTGRADELLAREAADKLRRSQMGGTPLNVSPNADVGLEGIVNMLANVSYDDEGNLMEGSAPPLEPQLQRDLLDLTSQYYQQTRNARRAAEMAWNDIIGPGGLEEATTGEDAGIPLLPGFLDPFQSEGETYQRPISNVMTQDSSTPGAGGVMRNLPDPAQHEGRIIRDTQTGERLQSNGAQWVPLGT